MNLASLPIQSHIYQIITFHNKELIIIPAFEFLWSYYPNQLIHYIHIQFLIEVFKAIVLFDPTILFPSTY